MKCHEYTVTYILDDAQEQRLQRVVALANLRHKEDAPENAKMFFNSMMLMGSISTINSRLDMWEKEYLSHG